MRERPILFSGPMVCAILDGRKTQTRRVVRWEPLEPGLNLQLSGLEAAPYATGQPEYGFVLYSRGGNGCWNQRTKRLLSPYGNAGDRLWVRETWRTWCLVHDGGAEPQAECCTCKQVDAYAADVEVPAHYSWRPSIFMPRWASRITLEVVSVRVERLQDISEDDARAEGLETYNDPVCGPVWGITPRWRSRARDAFSELWDTINGKRAPWASNPWVWVVEFRRCA